MNSMIYEDYKGVKHFNVCPGCNDLMLAANAEAIENKDIPIYYSEKHVREMGWKTTKNVMFCSPEQDYVWVCPECWTAFISERLLDEKKYLSC